MKITLASYPSPEVADLLNQIGFATNHAFPLDYFPGEILRVEEGGLHEEGGFYKRSLSRVYFHEFLCWETAETMDPTNAAVIESLKLAAYKIKLIAAMDEVRAAFEIRAQVNAQDAVEMGRRYDALKAIKASNLEYWGMFEADLKTETLDPRHEFQRKPKHAYKPIVDALIADKDLDSLVAAMTRAKEVAVRASEARAAAEAAAARAESQRPTARAIAELEAAVQRRRRFDQAMAQARTAGASSPQLGHMLLVGGAILKGRGLEGNTSVGLPVIKQCIIEILTKYTSSFKLSIFDFGHHHDKRMRAVMYAIKGANDVPEMERILERQLVVVQRAYKRNGASVSTHDKDQWGQDILSEAYGVAHLTQHWQNQPVKARNESAKGSGFVQAINQALVKLIEIDSSTAARADERFDALVGVPAAAPGATA